MDNFITQLISEFGEKVIVTGDAIANKASSYWDPTPISAKAIARPATADELSRIVKRCHGEGQIIVTHGGLTGCAQAANSTSDHLVISLERMNAIEEIDEIGGTITVQAGAILENVQGSVAEKGFYFPLDLGARGSCTIGGNAATNAGGINVIRYGMMRNHILGLEVVLADGTILSSMNKMLKNNAGYDLKQLFIGSEGTLGIVTRLVVKLETASQTSNTALCALDSFSKVIELLKHMKRSTGARLTAFEVMWGNYFDAVTADGFHTAPISRGHPYYVITECTGSNPETDEDVFMSAMEEALDDGLINDAVIPKSEAERKAVWIVREEFEPVLINKPLFLYDVSLPIKHMDEYIANVQKSLKTVWPGMSCFVIGHIGDGNLHLMVCPHEGDENLHDQSDKLVYGPLKELGGSVSAEHGIGHEKKKWLSHSRTDNEIHLMKTLKQTMDPKNILNPGVIF